MLKISEGRTGEDLNKSDVLFWHKLIIDYATHNKGVINGMESVVLATGNDTRSCPGQSRMHYASRNDSINDIANGVTIARLIKQSMIQLNAR